MIQSDDDDVLFLQDFQRFDSKKYIPNEEERLANMYPGIQREKYRNIIIQSLDNNQVEDMTRSKLWRLKKKIDEVSDKVKTVLKQFADFRK
mmetsp:Transcript_16700/g.16384  ORF Transcript_16700/g.16384 Transcript_16700/m.16384 type:complete len:91 (+) Transcript_16700:459-731(+)